MQIVCKSKMQERLYEVPSIMYQDPSEARAEIQETRLICLVSRVSYFYDFLLGTWYFVLGMRVGSENNRLKW